MSKEKFGTRPPASFFSGVASSTMTTVRETVCTSVQRPDARSQRTDARREQPDARSQRTDARSPPRQRARGRILKKPNFLKDYVQ